MNGNRFLITAAIMSFMIGVLHILIIFIGAPGYRYFGAGEEMAKADEAGSLTPALMTAAVTAFFFLFGIYALSGAGKIKKLPLTKAVLVIISFIFLLRGLGVVGDVYMIINEPAYPMQMIWFSVVAFIVGLCYTLGLRGNWSRL